MSNFHQELFQVQHAIRNSPVGDQLSKIERWQKFRSNETLDEWIDLLGPTAVVLTHQEHFLEFVLFWIKNLDEPTLRQFSLAASVHDMGEAKLGDIASTEKTVADELKEVDFALEAILSLPLDHPLILELLHSYQEVVKGDNESLHYIFKALERTEYLNTAIHLFEKLASGKEMEKGWSMIARVLSFDFPKVINYAESLPNIVGEYLATNRELIEQMFERSNFAVTAEFENNFNNSKEMWQKYLSLL
jgi:hypothetical protein